MEGSKPKDETRQGIAQGAAGPQPMPALTSDRFFRRLILDRSASPILPTTPVPDPRFSHAELTPSKVLSLRLQSHKFFSEQIFQPVRDAVVENAGAGLGVPP